MGKTTEPTIITEEQLKAQATKQVAKLQTMEVELSELQLALSNSPEFKQFNELATRIADKKKEIEKDLEKKMIENNVKSIEIPDVATYTIVDAKTWDYDEDLIPKKFIKKVVDSTAINNQYKLTGKLPNGATFVPKQYIKVTPKKAKK